MEISQQAVLESRLDQEGNITNTLTFTRSNPTSEINLDFVRVLVPLGSQLLSLSGNDDLPIRKSQARGLVTDPDLAVLDEAMEAGKTKYAFWLSLDPKASKTVKLVYRLPFRISASLFNNTDSYSLLIQKQPAGRPTKFFSSFTAEGFAPAEQSLGRQGDRGYRGLFAFSQNFGPGPGCYLLP